MFSWFTFPKYANGVFGPFCRLIIFEVLSTPTPPRKQERCEGPSGPESGLAPATKSAQPCDGSFIIINSAHQCYEESVICSLISVSLNVSVSCLSRFVLGQNMKYRLRKVIEKHNPNNQKYTDFKLVGLEKKKAHFSDSDSSDDDLKFVRWRKRHPVGKMKQHSDLALSQEFRRCTNTLPFVLASPSVVQSLQKALAEEEDKLQELESDPVDVDKATCEIEGIQKMTVPDYYKIVNVIVLYTARACGYTSRSEVNNARSNPGEIACLEGAPPYDPNSRIFARSVICSLISVSLNVSVSCLSRFVLGQNMKYRLRKVIEKHNPNNQKYTDFKLVGLEKKKAHFSDSDSSDDDLKFVRWRKRHPVGKMKQHSDLALSQEFRRCTNTLPFVLASPSVVQSLQKALAEEEDKSQELESDPVDVDKATCEIEGIQKMTVPDYYKESDTSAAPTQTTEDVLVLENSDSDSDYEAAAETGGIEDAEEREIPCSEETGAKVVTPAIKAKDEETKEVVTEAAGDPVEKAADNLVTETIKNATDIVSTNETNLKEAPPAVAPVTGEVSQQPSCEQVQNDDDDDDAGRGEGKITVVEHAVAIPSPDMDSATEDEKSQEIKSILKSNETDGGSNKSVKFS
eukprot:sb/3463006/